MPPTTRYAKSGDCHIAYQVLGKGPLDLVYVPGWISHLELSWELPPLAAFQERLASFSRLIMFDKRGTGLSDRTGEVQTLEQRMDDVRAVMDACGVERAALYGISEGGPMSMLFAATYPDRVSALALYGTFAKCVKAPDYPFGISPEEQAKRVGWAEHHWGEEQTFANVFWPSLSADENVQRDVARFLRMGASPSSAAALMKINGEIDLRSLLPALRVPTLVLHRTGDLAVPVDCARWMARQIPNAKFVELPGADHALFDDQLADEIEHFLTGARHVVEPDRVLATVMFNDIVASTERAAEIGDRRWRDLLGNYRRLARAELGRFRGREVNTAGDGFLATFDGPARAIRCAGAIRDSVRPLAIEVRSGLHTGEVELIGDDVGGIAVHMGARVAAAAQPGEVLVSSTVKDLVAGSGIQFADRGMHTLKGVPGEWRLFIAQ
jgi:pimeloyl-ACP methyl ester carboxylesterase